MRILHVINLGSACGGAERLAAELVAAQRVAGHDVRVLSSDRAAAGPRFSDVTWPQPGPGRVWGRLAGLFRNPRARAALGAELRDRRPDVVHLHTVGMLAPASLAELRGVPTVLTVHGPELFVRGTERWCVPAGGAARWPALALYRGVVGPVWRRALRVVDVHVAPSAHLAGLLARDFAPVRVVPNGFTPVPTAPVPPGGPSVVFAGRLDRIKGPQVLLAAVPEIVARHPGVRVTFCGDGPAAVELRATADRLGVAEAVELTGWLGPAEVRRRIAAADLLVVPSLAPEAFGLSCLEAFAAGTPVVAAAVGALPELVEPGVTGALVAPGDPAALAAAVGDLLADPRARARLGAAARDRSVAYRLDAHAAALDLAYAAAIHREDPR
jgi:glycosyltransferase involved in cell wall biosynthesis